MKETALSLGGGESRKTISKKRDHRWSKSKLPALEGVIRQPKRVLKKGGGGAVLGGGGGADLTPNIKKKKLA